MNDTLEHKTRDGETICYTKTTGKGPCLVWLGGFRSDMRGSKAEFVHQLAQEKGWPFVRFDYFGHGASSGEFEAGNLSKWLADALCVIDEITTGPLVLLGSSMGGWLALLCAAARPKRVRSMALIAPAPDFTRALMWPSFDQAVQQQILQTGKWMQPSPYGPVPITLQLINDGDQHLILDKPICFDGPVRILMGQQDKAVPWKHSFALVEKITSSDVIFSLAKTGDHSLSRREDLVRLRAVLLELMAK